MLASVTMLTACSLNPLVRWEPPPKPADGDTGTLEYAKSYARTARAAYQKKIYEQVRGSTTLNAGLILLGAAVLGLAAADAHRDAFIATALVGGTGYALGKQNIRPERLTAYQQGVKGINCALEAITPLDVGAGPLERKLVELSLKRQGVIDSLAKVNGSLKVAKAVIDAEDRKAVSDTIEGANAAVRVANDVLRAGRDLSAKQRRAGNQLINTVDRIAADVEDYLNGTIPDLSSVPTVIAGLAEFAGGFAPGTDLAKTLNGFMGKYSIGSSQGRRNRDKLVSTAPTDDDAKALFQDVADLLEAQAQLEAVTADVQGMLTGFEGASAADALKQCGVDKVSTPLRASTDTVTFTANSDSTQSFIVTGGLKPYVGQLDQGGSTGVSVKNPVPFESRFEVIATKAAGADKHYTLTVMDSSSPGKTVQVAIEIGKADTNAGGGNANAELAKLKGAIEAEQGAKTSFGPTAGGNRYSIDSVREDPNKLVVELKCTLSGGQTDSVKDVKGNMFEQPKVKPIAIQILSISGVDALHAMVELKSTPSSCVK